MMTGLVRALRDERGSAMIEYALTAALVSLAMLAGVNFIIWELSQTVSALGSALLTNATSGI